MRILHKEWHDGYLDQTLLPEFVRIKVHLWENLEPLDDLYFRPTSSAHLLWNYSREFGIRQVVRKSISRLSERGRNRKFLACGIGQVIESASDVSLGSWVVFVATAHPKCSERVVVPSILVRSIPKPSHIHDDEVLVRAGEPQKELSLLGGWSPYSGRVLEAGFVAAALDTAEQLVTRPKLDSAISFPLTPATPVQERSKVIPAKSAKLKAAVIGYGHYAKTNILPNLGTNICIAAVHEIDSTQLGFSAALAFAADTSPVFRPEERYDVCFLAGYHHTHAPLAAEALRRGMIAVSEKPLATTAKELDELLDALRTTNGRYFAGFHKRYSELNDICCHYLRRDSIGGPISYHCIVHEVPLPRRHWYNWPNSKTRVVSNGCHWMDHWMFLNEFAPITRHTATRMKCGDIVVTAEAANDASFSMTLTDQGSSRIGVQDTVELRSGDVTVRVMNGASLIAEDSTRILKRKRVNRTGSYARMYREIAAKIGSGASGDSRESIERSTRFMLEVEDSLSR